MRVDVVADAQLARRDDALALVPDVEEHLVLVDLDDRAVDELAVLDFDHRAVDGVGEGHAEVVDDNLTRGVVALLVERAEAAGGGSDGGGGGGSGGVGQGTGCFRGGRDACVHGRRALLPAPTRGTRVAAPLVDRHGSCGPDGQRRRATTRSSGSSVVGLFVAVGARLDAADPLDDEAVAVEEQAQLARCVAAGPQVDLERPPVGIAHLGAFVGDAALGVERHRRSRPGRPPGAEPPV